MNIDETNMTVPQNWHELRNSIPALRDQTYLNTGVSGPPPTFALEEEVRWTRWLGETGPGRPDVMQEAFAELDRVRSAVAGFIGADEDQVALTQSCSDGMAVVAAGLPWQAGDEVVVSGELEHISGLLPWYDLQRRRGVVVRTVAARGGFLTADDVRRAMTDRTKLICMSHVAYNTGAQLPVADVAQLARDRGVWLLVDGAQGPGNVPVDVGRLGCHFYACAGQKWMLGPDGTGALYVAEEAVEAVQATHLGWASVVLEDKPVEQLRLHDRGAPLRGSGETRALAGGAAAFDGGVATHRHGGGGKPHPPSRGQVSRRRGRVSQGFISSRPPTRTCGRAWSCFASTASTSKRRSGGCGSGGASSYGGFRRRGLCGLPSMCSTRTMRSTHLSRR